MKFRGLDITIENSKGSVRRGTTDDGHHWETKMKYPYGYIDDTKGADGEEVDVFVGPHEDADNVYVIHQKLPWTGKVDEDKVMLGFNTAAQAKQAFLEHYDDPSFFGSMTTMTFDEFKAKVYNKRGTILKGVRVFKPIQAPKMGEEMEKTEEATEILKSIAGILEARVAHEEMEKSLRGDSNFDESTILTAKRLYVPRIEVGFEKSIASESFSSCKTCGHVNSDTELCKRCSVSKSNSVEAQEYWKR